jgi:hypothetical protein
MPEISIGPWAVRTPIVTRYLETEWVDSFLAKGVLRLSSLKKFREHKDEERGDPGEGLISQTINVPNGRHIFVGRTIQEAYILCTATIESPKLEASFDTSDGFRINDSIGFANAISMYIPGFIGGIEGPCTYQEPEALFKEESVSIGHPGQSSEDVERFFDEYEMNMAVHRRDALFTKPIRFAHQGEYRFIWFTNGLEQDFIEVACPEALKYCQRMGEEDPHPNR